MSWGLRSGSRHPTPAEPALRLVVADPSAEHAGPLAHPAQRAAHASREDVITHEAPDELTPELAVHLIEAFRSQARAIVAETASLENRVMGPNDVATCPVLGRLPRLAWDLRTDWRLSLARAYWDLADDVAAGEWPDARCGGEEWALFRVLVHGDGAESVPSDLRQGKEVLAEVYDFVMEGEDLDQLFADTNGGGYLPRDHSLRPRRWFRPFEAMPARDPDRGTDLPDDDSPGAPITVLAPRGQLWAAGN